MKVTMPDTQKQNVKVLREIRPGEVFVSTKDDSPFVFMRTERPSCNSFNAIDLRTGELFDLIQGDILYKIVNAECIITYKN